MFKERFFGQQTDMDIQKKDKRNGFILLLIALGVVAVLTGFLLLLFLISLKGTQYDNFKGTRAQEIEELYGLVLTDDITLGHYSANAGFDDEQVLTLYTDDFRAAMANCFPHTVEEYEDINDGSNMRAHFRYSADGKSIGVNVYQFSGGGEYTMELWL